MDVMRHGLGSYASPAGKRVRLLGHNRSSESPREFHGHLAGRARHAADRTAGALWTRWRDGSGGMGATSGTATSRLAGREARGPRRPPQPGPCDARLDGIRPRHRLRTVRPADPHARTVALLHGETGFARDVASGARAAATALAFEVRAVGFPPGQA